ncbi:MAG: DsbA family protein [OCS116 cluster bacterium]|nr:DsbA family protein [OCS116 cluster bacterium]
MKLSKLFGFAALVISISFAGNALAADTGPLYENIKIEDHVMGNPDAKVTIVEYASLTCPHCANFHENTFKKFKTNYIDTGKVKFIYRNFHLDQLAFAGAMLAECAPKDQYFPIVDLIFTNQQKWIRAEKQFAEMVGILKLVGYSDEKVNECFAQKETISDLLDDRKYATETLDVNSTPTLFINGEKQDGGNTAYEAFSATVDALLAE